MSFKKLVATFVVCILLLAGNVSAQTTFVVTIESAKAVQTLTKYHARHLFSGLRTRAEKQSSVQSLQIEQAITALDRHYVVTVRLGEEEAFLKSMNEIGDVLVRPIARYTVHDGNQFTDDSLSSQQYALGVVNAVEAWKRSTGAGILVGVIDTGIDWDHEDLAASLSVNPLEDINSNGRFDPWPSTVTVDGVTGDLDGIDNDDNGYADDVIGYDFVDQSIRNIGDDQTRDPIPFDEHGHGTSVAGVIVAQANNGKGIAGLAFNSKVLGIRAFDATGNGEEDDIAAAIVYAALNQVKVINMSFGDAVDSPVLRDAIEFARSAGCVLVSSAGNTGVVSRQFPAGYSGVLVVASTNQKDLRSAYSSTGSLINLSAPGEAIITTAVNSRYRTVSGTSFSAPYVAATAALLLEKFPAASAQEIASTIEANTVDLGEIGWDGDFGTGRLDADLCMKSPGLSLIELTSPYNEQTLNTVATPVVTVSGSTVTSLFTKYELFYGRGLEPTSWTKFSEGSRVYKSTLGQLDVSGLATGDYVVRLVVSRPDGRTIERRSRVLVSAPDSLVILSSVVDVAWQTDVSTVVLSVETNLKTYCSVKCIDSVGRLISETSDVTRFTRRHSFPLNDVPFGDSVSIVITCISDDFDTIRTTVPVFVPAVAFPLTGASTGAGQNFAGYVLNDVRDLYGDGKASFVMSDLASSSFGNILTLKKEAVGFSRKDSVKQVWIPRGMGDADGNGRTEIFANVIGKSVLFESSVENGNPFETIRFADSTGKLNAAGMADVTGDGKEELLMLSDSGCIVYTWRNGSFEHLGTAYNTSSPSLGNSGNRIDEVSVAAGDFDNDGRVEIAFSDTDGDLLVYEFDGARFNLDFIQEYPGGGGSGYVACGDIDGDGVPDVVLGVPDSMQARPDGEYGRSMWTYHFIRSTGPNKYEEFATEKIYGLRYGIGYRNGVDVGQLDMRGGNEVVICAFPRLYVFTWDPTQQTMRPLLYRSDVSSPRFLIYDFNKNGVNEVGYGVTVPELGFMTDFVFTEFDTTSSRLATPNGLRAKIVNDTSVNLSWMPIIDASGYIVQMSSSLQQIYRLVDSTTFTSIRIDSLSPNSWYRFRVFSYSNSGHPQSASSNVVEVNLGRRVTATQTFPDSLLPFSSSNSLQLRVKYNGALRSGGIEPSSFILTTTTDSVLATGVSAVVAGSSELVVGFRFERGYTGPAKLVCGEVLDEFNAPSLRSVLNVEIDVPSTPEPLVISSFEFNGSTGGELVFSKAMNEESVTDVLNYILFPAGSVKSATVVNETTVDVDFGTSPPLAALGVTYALSAINVVSVSGDTITTGSGNTVEFLVTASNVDNSYVYPHPYPLSSSAPFTFANLPAFASLRVYSQKFDLLKTIEETDGNGGAQWDLVTDAGIKLTPGFYYYKVEGGSSSGSSDQSGFKKFQIKR